MPAPALLAIAQGGNGIDHDDVVAGLVAAVAEAAPEVQVAGALIDVHQPDLASALAGLAPGRPVVVVPVLLSAGSHVYGDVAAGLAAARGPEATLAPAIGPDDALVQILASRLHEAALGPGDVVVLAAVGSSDHRTVRDCLEVGRRLGGLLARSVTVGFLNSAVPRLASAIETQRRLHPGVRIVVSSYLLSPGPFAEQVAGAGGDVVAQTLLVPGRRPPQQLVDLVLQRYRDAIGAQPALP